MRFILAGQSAQAIKALHDRYGEVVRIAPNELSFIDGDAWKVIYGTRTGHGQKAKDHRFYPPTAGGAPSILISNDVDHSRFRRLLSHAFSDSSLRGQEPIIKYYVDLLMQRLHEKAGSGKQALDIVSWYNFTTFDIIGDLAFGEPFDCLKNSTYHQWVTIVISHARFSAYTNVARRFPGWKLISKFITPKRVMDQRNLHFRLTQEKVKGRLSKSNERPDFFGNILKHKDTERAFSLEEMITNGNTLIVAGSETTATLLSGATYLLLKNPRVLQKLQEEVRTTFNSDDEITLDNCNKLEYIHAVLTEALRMYPPVPVGLPRIVDTQGDIVAGYWVPGGVSAKTDDLASESALVSLILVNRPSSQSRRWRLTTLRQTSLTPNNSSPSDSSTIPDLQTIARPCYSPSALGPGTVSGGSK
jgi:cytochrome P450